ncbi:MAG TPA: hypothetical protein VK465_12945 [Fibrobacteria bacterium]|nr:hypothetical protein [Fibrobacteria bacterium]
MFSLRQFFATGLLAALSLGMPRCLEAAPGDTTLLELPESTVQAARKAKTPDQLPQKVEIISSRDMALTPADDLTDQLKKSVALDVVQYPGLLSGVGLRGFRPQFSGLNQRTAPPPEAAS